MSKGEKNAMATNIQKYLAFLKTVEYGSFTRAGELLGYTQSNISHMVNDLETEWRVSLLERKHSGVSLTSDGTALMPYIRAVYDDYLKLQTQVDALNGLQMGILRIGTLSSVATSWLPGVLKDFRRDHPGIDIELLVEEQEGIERSLMEGRIDCGFLRLPTRGEFDSTFLWTDRLLAILPEGHHLCACDRVPIQALGDYPFIFPERENMNEILEIMDILKARGVRMKPHFITGDHYSMLAMIEIGLGISVLSDLALQRVSYKIVAKEFDEPQYRQVGLVLRRGSTLSAVVRGFAEHVKSLREENGQAD